MTTPPKPSERSRLRWFRFSLRGVLILMTVVAVWCGVFLGRARDERLAAEAVEAAGGKVIYDWQVKGLPAPTQPQLLRSLLGRHFFDRIARVELNGYGGCAADFKFSALASRLQSLSGLRDLWLLGIELDHDDYRAIGRLKKLEVLSIGLRAKVRNQDVAEIAEIASLRELNLTGVIITPAGLAEIARLPRLENLSITPPYPYVKSSRLIESLAKYRLTDAAANAIAGRHTLRQLTLKSTVITDNGVARLRDLKGLESLVIQSPEITEKALLSIKQLERLEWLGAIDWRIAAEGWLPLKEMSNLTGIAIRLPDDQGNSRLPDLANLHGLKVLRISSSSISDSSIRALHDMTNLRELNLCDTSVNRVGQAADLLREALPDCTISWPLTKAEEDAKRIYNFYRFDISPPAATPAPTE